MSPKSKSIPLKENVLKDKKEQARINRSWFDQNRVLCINIMGSPGSGKTTLLEMTAAQIERKISVIEGDLQTRRDADRIEQAGVEAWQITTGQSCHLNAFMIHDLLGSIQPTQGQILFIENVGNLVCPASHDLGAHLNVVLLSTPEGDDKVAKYPVMFQKADLLVLSKVDLIKWIQYDKDRVYEDFQKVNPRAPVIEISCNDIGEGSGLNKWIDFITQER